MLTSDAYAEHVVARLLDYFAIRGPWQRRLWIVGSLTVLDEVVEAGIAVRDGVFHERILGELRDEATARIEDDHGIGDQTTRRALRKALKRPLVAGGLGTNQVGQLAHASRQRYLGNWGAALDGGAQPVGPERVARDVASHLLDSGAHPSRLHGWWTWHLKTPSATWSLSDLLRKAETDALAAVRDYDVLITFARSPGKTLEQAPGWTLPSAVPGWIAAQGAEAKALRQYGGLLVTVQASDPHGASERAGEQLDTLTARAALGASVSLDPHALAWVQGHTKSLQLRRPRGVDIPTLEREDRLVVLGPTTAVDSALELASHLDTGPPGPAATGGWAAIENLLLAPREGGNHQAADRLASLVACSFPRAELTKLGYVRQSAAKDALGQQLVACTTNQARAALTASALKASAWSVPNVSASDRAAAVRMESLLADPQATLTTVREYAAQSLRRLYRQRNLVMHGGRTEGAALRPALRTAAPLVGAGLDRIVHAWFRDSVHPVQLAAKAELSLELVGTGAGPDVTGLLE